MRNPGFRSGLKTAITLACGAAGLLVAAPVAAQQSEADALPVIAPGSAAAQLPEVDEFSTRQWIFGIKIYVSDIDLATNFYAELFDMDILGKAGTGGRAVSMEFRGTRAGETGAGGGGFVLIINPVPEPMIVPNPAIMIAVSDLAAFRERAAEMGLILRADGEDAVLGQDPDGNWFKVVEPSFIAMPERSAN